MQALGELADKDSDDKDALQGILGSISPKGTPKSSATDI